MEIIAWIIIFVLVALIGVTVYFVVDYMKYKKDTDAEQEADRKAALSHDKYIIDNTNTITGTLNSNLADTTNKADYLKAGFASWHADLGQIMRFGSNESLRSAGAAGAATTGFQIGAMPNAPITDMALLKHVSMVSGLTARDLTGAVGKGVSLCGAGANADRCIKFPDAAGDTYLTGLTPTSKLVLDAPQTRMKGNLIFDETGTLSIGSNATGGLAINTQTGVLSVGDNGFSYKKTGDGAIPTLKVDNSGQVKIDGSVSLTSNGTEYASISYNPATRKMMIDAKDGGGVYVNGDVSISDGSEQVFGTLGKDIDPVTGSYRGLRISNVMNDRFVINANVYVPSDKTIYGTNVATAPSTFVF